jgi:hypothetical protein
MATKSCGQTWAYDAISSGVSVNSRVMPMAQIFRSASPETFWTSSRILFVTI